MSIQQYFDLTIGGNFEVELTQEEAALVLKIHDYGIDNIEGDEKVILYSITSKLKDKIWP